MAWFKRKKNDSADQPQAEQPQAPEPAGDQQPTAEAVTPPAETQSEAKTQGPWDISDEGIPELPRIDFGSLQLPAVQGMQLMPLPDPLNEQQIGALEIIVGTSQMQMSVAATKRSGGLWDEILVEFPQMLAESGIPCELVEEDGVTRIKATLSEENGQAMPMLVEGYQGNAWLLRVIYRGAAADDAYARAALADVVRGTVISRGDQFLAPGETIGLTMPADIEGQAQEAPAEPQPEAPQWEPVEGDSSDGSAPALD